MFDRSEQDLPHPRQRSVIPYVTSSDAFFQDTQNELTVFPYKLIRVAFKVSGVIPNF